MKPKNAFQKRVSELSARIPEPDSEDLKRIDHIAYELEGYVVASNMDERDFNHSYNCRYEPHTIRHKDYYDVVMSFKGMQVIRTFCVEAWSRSVNAIVKNRWFEVIQRWYDAEGNEAVLAKSFRAFTYGEDEWAYGSPLSLKEPHADPARAKYRTLYQSQIASARNCRYKSVCGFVRQRGLPRSKMRDSLKLSLSSIIQNTMTPFGEYMLKHKRMKDFVVVCGKFSMYEKFTKYFASYKVACRHGYNITDIGLWCDMMEFLETLGKDLHSPVYICPDNLKVAHDHWYNKIQYRRKKEMLKKAIEEAKKHEEVYAENMSVFFGLNFKTKSGLTIRTVTSAAEMAVEGKMMNHCVGWYWRKRDSLIMVCRTDKDDRIATIEVSLKDCSPAQIRCANNHKPKEYDEIHAALIKHKGEIKRLLAIRNRQDAEKSNNNDNIKIAV